jgi:hypothetical protein
LSFIAMIAAIVLVPRYFKSIERQKLQDTLRMAYEKGQDMPPELIASMIEERNTIATPDRDLRVGVIWLGVAVGLAAFGIAIGFTEPDASYPMLGIAAFPGFIGLAFIVLGLIARKKS